MPPSSVTTLAQTTEWLRHSRVIAVLGAHHEPHRAATRVPAYLASQGYTVIGVNPRFAGQRWWGQEVVGRLTDIPAPVDIVDVFRRSTHLLSHLEEVLDMRPHPRLVWLQQGIRHATFCAALRAVGIATVEDRCTLADHRNGGLRDDRKKPTD